MKLFGIITLLCKLDLSIAKQQILSMPKNGQAFKKVWVNLCQNSCMRSTQGPKL
jgi:hypothetical protein